jgi:DNA-binding IclR family transcriptional regulator
VVVIAGLAVIHAAILAWLGTIETSPHVGTIAAEIDVNVTRTRDAVDDLEREGLVVLSGDGAVSLTPKAIEMLAKNRALLEGGR